MRPTRHRQAAAACGPAQDEQGQGSRVRAGTPGEGQTLPRSGQVLKPLCVSLCICKVFSARCCGDEMRSCTCSLAGDKDSVNAHRD